ncbi:MAG: hypothetical protein KDD44_05635 [Bdellovibrionales bacterium]|nr:hypothetical protein [Bdellovibrionales bacterium]
MKLQITRALFCSLALITLFAFPALAETDAGEEPQGVEVLEAEIHGLVSAIDHLQIGASDLADPDYCEWLRNVQRNLGDLRAYALTLQKIALEKRDIDAYINSVALSAVLEYAYASVSIRIMLDCDG